MSAERVFHLVNDPARESDMKQLSSILRKEFKSLADMATDRLTSISMPTS